MSLVRTCYFLGCPVPNPFWHSKMDSICVWIHQQILLAKMDCQTFAKWRLQLRDSWNLNAFSTGLCIVCSFCRNLLYILRKLSDFLWRFSAVWTPLPQFFRLDNNIKLNYCYWHALVQFFEVIFSLEWFGFPSKR